MGVSGAGQSGSGNMAGNGALRPTSATSVSVGTDMACATVTDGSIWCWGDNDQGQLGDGTRTNSDTPVRVLGIEDAVAVTAGGTWNSGGQGAARSAFACAVLRGGTVQCWGVVPIIDSSNIATTPIPITIPGVSEAVAVAGGDWHACALTRDGSVECWGDDSRGELGNDSTNCLAWACPPGTMDGAARKVAGISGARAISAKGAMFSCAVLGDGSIPCWGGFDAGMSFDPPTATSLATPMLIPGVMATPSGLDVGYHHTCAIAPDALSVTCWGDNQYGELGNGATNDDAGAVRVQGLGSPIVAVSAGLDETCAVLGDGTVRCWGAVAWGGSLTPAAVDGVTDAVAVSCGYGSSCALTKQGSVRCWGQAAGGMSSPVTVIGP